MTLRDYVGILRRVWWVVVGLAILGAVVGAAVAYLSPPTFRAVTVLYVATSGSTSATDLQAGNAFAVQRAQTYAGLATTSSVLGRAASAVGGQVDEASLARTTSATARADTSIIDIVVTSRSAERASTESNAVAEALVSSVGQLDSVGGSASPVSIDVVQPATIPTIADSPKPRVDVLLGGIAGAVLGLVIVITAYSLDSRIRTLGDLPRTPAIVSATGIPAARSRNTARRAARSEGFRALRANLQFGSRVSGTVAISGAGGGVAAGEVALSLAAALGETGVSVVVCDFDLRPEGRERAQTQLFPDGEGVADVLAGLIEVEEVLTPMAAENVRVVGAGEVTTRSAQLMSTDSMTLLLEDLRAAFQYVLLSLPPLTERSEAAVAAARSDGTLLVVEAGRTRVEDVVQALELTAGVGVRSVSVALDEVREAEHNAGWRRSTEGNAINR